MDIEEENFIDGRNVRRTQIYANGIRRTRIRHSIARAIITAEIELKNALMPRSAVTSTPDETGKFDEISTDRY